MYWGKIIDPDNIPIQIIANLLPVLFLIYLGIKNGMNKNNWIVFAFPFLYFISFSFSNPIMFKWYLNQIEPFWILISVIGFEVFVNKIQKKYPNNNFIIPITFLLICIGPVFYYSGFIFNKHEGSKVSQIKMGMYVNDHMKIGDVIGLSDIGIVGYYLPDAYILDFIGLTRTDVLKFYPIDDPCLNKKQLYVIPPNLIMQKKPD